MAAEQLPTLPIPAPALGACPDAEAGAGARIRMLDRDRTIPETVGQRVARLRQALGWTQEDLAFEAGVGQSTVSLLEQDGHIPLASTLAGLAAALGTTMDYLWDGTLPIVPEETV